MPWVDGRSGEMVAISLDAHGLAALLGFLLLVSKSVAKPNRILPPLSHSKCCSMTAAASLSPLPLSLSVPSGQDSLLARLVRVIPSSKKKRRGRSQYVFRISAYACRFHFRVNLICSSDSVALLIRLFEVTMGDQLRIFENRFICVI